MRVACRSQLGIENGGLEVERGGLCCVRSQRSAWSRPRAAIQDTSLWRRQAVFARGREAGAAALAPLQIGGCSEDVRGLVLRAARERSSAAILCQPSGSRKNTANGCRGVRGLPLFGQTVRRRRQRRRAAQEEQRPRARARVRARLL
ncbi:hypothetical protein MTO96_041092 [Rhipicephalus appendiculatus]